MRCLLIANLRLARNDLRWFRMLLMSQGMMALESKDRVPTLSFNSFGAFIAGAAARANLVGDTGPSDPQNWIGDFGKGTDYLLRMLHAISSEAMTSYSERLAALFAEGN